MKIEDCNPYLRAAEIQPAVLEGAGARMAYDHRLFYILEGEGALMLEDAALAISPDTLLCFRPGVGYHFRGKLRVAVLNFDVTRAAAHRKKPICPPPVAEFDPDRIFDAAVTESLPVSLVLPDSGHLREDVLQLVRAFDRNDPIADGITSALLKKLLTDLLLAQRPRKGPGEDLVERVRRYIRFYAAEIKGNESIGQEFGYHPVYIAALFREITGETLHHAILAERVHLACRWLTQTDRSVEEVAFDTGFSSRSHFCTVFKALTGMSPGAYRAEKR